MRFIFRGSGFIAVSLILFVVALLLRSWVIPVQSRVWLKTLRVLPSSMPR